ncbi:MAG: hypothetical protein LBN26_00795 [Christensenellaceae bacterium]|jgi:hypothetical protein|nr:hypothetical protein [Christensenellaceae bacterium]
MSTVKIKSVWMDSACCDKQGMGIALDVDLDNGASMMVYLDSKAGEPSFTDILNGKYRAKPKTDGERVYWENGASLSFQEMIDMLQAEKRARAAG